MVNDYGLPIPAAAMKTIILAGGKGTRLYPLLIDLPKPLIQVSGKPLLEHILINLRRYGFSDFTFKVCYMSDKIKDYFSDGAKWSCKIDYFEEAEPLGTAGGLKYLEAQENPVMIIYGDVIININLRKMLDFHRKNNADATLVVHKSSHPQDSDVVILGKDSRITRIVHKPGNLDYGDITNAALYILGPGCFSYIPDSKCDFGKDIIPILMRKGLAVYGYDTDEYMKDIGTTERVVQVENDIKAGKVLNHVEAVFLDRDGTINEEINLLHKKEDFKLINDVPKAIRLLNSANIPVIVTTNQPVVARNLCTEEELNDIHTHMSEMLKMHGAYVDDIFYCPHHPEKHHKDGNPVYRIDCGCRKPKPGMFIYAAKKYNLNLSRCFVIGDTTTDILAAKNAGCRSILVKTGFKGADKRHEVKPDFEFDTLTECVEFILGYNKNNIN